MSQLIAPAEKLALSGVIVSEELFQWVQQEHNVLGRFFAYFAETLKTYEPAGAAFLANTRFVQPDLARSLRLIREQGPDAFYRGEIAERIVADMQAAQSAWRANPVLLAAGQRNHAANLADSGNRWVEANDLGVLDADDLRSYKPVWRKPLAGTYRGRQILTVPPAGAGGIVVLETLNILESFPMGSNQLDPADHLIESWAFGSANHLHVLAEAHKIAWADWPAYIADPDYVKKVPVSRLISKEYAQDRASGILLEEAQDFGPAPGLNGFNTNHVSVLDAQGNCASVTTSLGQPFGSLVVPPGCGFCLNSRMSDFRWDAPDHINRPQPGKTPISFNTPTVVLEGDTLRAVLGGLGRSSITIGVVQTLLNLVDFGMDLAHAIDAPRYEDAHRYPNLVLEQVRVAANVLAELQKKKHILRGVPVEYLGRPIINAVRSNVAIGVNEAVSDPRYLSPGFGLVGTPEQRDEANGAVGQGT